MKKFVLFLIISMCVVIVSKDTCAQAKQRVKFATSSSSATLKGTIRGYAYRDYLVRASSGQTIDIGLTFRNNDSVFSIFLPNGNNLEGAAQMNEFSGELPVTGDYVVRVGMMRTDARRPRSISNYILKISIR